MDRTELFRQSLDYFLAPVRDALRDEEVTEILVNGHDQVFVEREGRLQPTTLRFPDSYWLGSLAQNLAEFIGRKLDDEHQSLSGRLPNGYRVHVVIPPASRCGVCLSIRKFDHDRLTLEQLVERGSLSPEASQLLQLAVEMKCNLVVSGGTGTGKTTLLNALAAAIPHDERVLVLEETSELRLNQPHAVYFETQQAKRNGLGAVTMRDLFVDSLRLRPDRILVGEVRRGEALDMVQSMLSGHCGALTTVHANSPADAMTRLETLCLMSDTALPHDAARMQVAAAIHLVVQIERFEGFRRVQAVSECRGINRRGQIRWRRVLESEFRAEGPHLRATGKIPRFLSHPYGQRAAQKYPLVVDMLRRADLGSAANAAKDSQEKIGGTCPPRRSTAMD
jgi:pilus assembly protein CpaF